MIHLHDVAVREFHVSRQARERYGLSEALFSLTGNVVLADFGAARELAHRINAGRDVGRFPERAIGAGELNAMGLIDEVLHLVVADYRRNNPGVMARTLDGLQRSLGVDALAKLLSVFVTEFPPTPVYRRELTVAEYLAGATGGVAHREVAIEELLLLWLANSNPAFVPFRELFDDTPLRKRTAYLETIDGLRELFAEEPAVGGEGRNLFEELQRPMRAAPHSLQGQLDFIRAAWSDLIGPTLTRLLSSLDFLAEESRPWFGPGPGPVEIPAFVCGDEEPEAYSRDLDWMPRAVLLAKNAYVWLDQLSALYGRPITTLDQIPDAELERLSGWGFTGLWLIGVWERSRASARIKRMMGDHDAVASAYSLLDYRIADDLGGEPAFLELKDSAWRHGIRMATDMVPNHMGIDSRWVLEHPDWFIGLEQSPFPAYSFTGSDLCDDERVGVYLEDRYWNRTDAAVVFKRVDHWTGAERYIYHGNDGTSMPWNDTAQLDYRDPAVREAVIQTILHVARLSPIIRFDAAMTLTKKHYQRLWFPEPGSGGDIPSRAEYGMTRSEFDVAMPQEFWREVVDRIAEEAPDTLLLAEAFWLLEGYFVRSLGMHRVYNSAFMNMLRDERNADYRRLITSTLEFDPQILKRYVNFMSNPDERTAVDQFGSDDKYFGVATMMATLPGMPMFGHGQIEGLADRGPGREVRYGVPPATVGRAAEPRSRTAPRTPAVSAARPAPGLRRGGRFRAVRLRALRRFGGRQRVRLLESVPGAAQPRRVPQPVRRDRGSHPDLGGGAGAGRVGRSAVRVEHRVGAVITARQLGGFPRCRIRAGAHPPVRRSFRPRPRAPAQGLRTSRIHGLPRGRGRRIAAVSDDRRPACRAWCGECRRRGRRDRARVGPGTPP
jgi:glycosidase